MATATEQVLTILVLNQLLKRRTVVQNLWYQNQQLDLDGYHFINCRFDNCVLITNNGDFQITRCFIADDCKVGLGTNMVKAICLFHLRHLPTPQTGAPFLPQRHEDNTISINMLEG
jgi:hypothetical protein